MSLQLLNAKTVQKKNPMAYKFYHWNKMVIYMPIADSPAIEKRQPKAKAAQDKPTSKSRSHATQKPNAVQDQSYPKVYPAAAIAGAKCPRGLSRIS